MIGLLVSIIFLKTNTIYKDFVSHPKQLTKVSSYNIRENMFACIAAFLDHRSQQAIINNCWSNSIHITCGVPQGSVLGPTLLLLYTNDLTNAFENLNCVVKHYAEDAKLYSSFILGDYSTVLVNAIDHLIEWFKIWQLRIANNRCIARWVSIIKTSASCDYAIYGYKLQWSNLETLVVEFTWQISKTVHTGHSRTALILKCFHTRSSEV